MQIRMTSGEVVSEQGFRALFPNTSMPQQLSEALINEFGGSVVFEGPQATGGTVYQTSVYGGIEQVNGKWFTKYSLGPAFFDTEDEDGVVTTAAQNEVAYKAAKDAEQAKSVRASRGEKLKETDWTQVADAPVDQAEWATYRQALRDLPATVTSQLDAITDPLQLATFLPVFPEKPE